MMQFAERHVLTVNKPSTVKKVLDAFSAGEQAQACVSPETRRGLVEFSKQGFNRLILNLQVMKGPFAGPPAAYINLNVCQMGGVLVLTGQVPRPWTLRVEELCRHHFFPRLPRSNSTDPISCAVSEIKTAVRQFAWPVWRTKGK